MSIIAQTPRLIIREYLPEEEHLFVDLHKDEQVLRYLPRRNEEEYRNFFAAALQANGNPNGLNRWGIFDAATGDFIGACLLRNPVDAPEKVELGYSMGVKYWGMGIATEMAKAVIDYGFNRMNFAMICAVTDPENKASQNVLLKSGMQRDGEVFWYEAILPYFELKNPNVL